MNRKVLLLVAAAAVFATGCAARRLPPPVVQQYLAVLVDASGLTIVHRSIVTELYPFLTLTDCPATGPYVVAAQRSCSGLDARRRVYALVHYDAKRKAALYQERTWNTD